MLAMPAFRWCLGAVIDSSPPARPGSVVPPATAPVPATGLGVLSFLRLHWRFSPRRSVLTVVLMLAAGVAEMAGVLMLVPLIQALDPQVGSDGRIQQFLASTGLPISPGPVLVVFALAVTLRGVLALARDQVTARLRLELVDDCRVRLVNAFARADWSAAARLPGADLTHLLSHEVSRIAAGSYLAIQCAVTVIVVLAQTAVGLVLAPLVTLAAIPVGLLLMLVVRPMMRIAREQGKNISETGRMTYRRADQLTAVLKWAKSAGAETAMADAYRTEIGHARDAQYAFERTASRTRNGINLLAALGVGLLVYLLLLLETPTAELLVLVLVFARLIPSVNQVQSYLIAIANAAPAVAVVAATEAALRMHAEPADIGPPPPLERAIRVDGVTVRPDPERPPALDGISVRVPARATTALLGPSGAGKTTLADLLAGLTAPDEGSVFVDDVPLDRATRAAWRRAVSYVPQEVPMVPGTLRQNLLLDGGQHDEAALWRALDTAAVGDLVRGLPLGLETLVGEHGLGLSGGERQRLALARALLRRPALLVLDEATNALDAGAVAAIRASLEALRGQITIVLIGHEAWVGDAADHVIRLDGGRVVASGDGATGPAEIRA